MAFIINEKRVDDDVIEEEFDAIKEHYMNLGEVVCCDRDEEFMGYARDNVINRTLLLQESIERFGEPGDAEIDGMVEQLKQEHGGEEQFYQNTGFTPADDFRIRRKVSATLAVDKMLEAEIGPDPEPAEEDLRKYYDDHLENFMSEEEVRVSQIFKEPKSHEEAKECYVGLRKIRDRILDGEDFDQVANEASDKKDDEIDLGFFKQGETMPEIESLTFSMRDGEISPIVATHFGFHIFKVTGRKEPEPVPFEQVRDQLGDRYLADRREHLVAKLVDSLKAKSTIEEVKEEGEEVMSNQ